MPVPHRVSFPGGVHEKVAPIVAALVTDLEAETGEAPVEGHCWGFAPRKIRGSATRWSNHAWGLAIDYNAPAHPLGSRGTWQHPDAVRRVAARYGFRWGGDYSGRADEMHFEYMGTPTQAERLVRRLDNIEEDDMALRRGDSGKNVAALQHRLKEWYGLSVTVDGQFGPATETALRAWEQSVGLEGDGVFSDMDYVLFGSQRSDERDRQLRADIETSSGGHSHEATVTLT